MQNISIYKYFSSPSSYKTCFKAAVLTSTELLFAWSKPLLTFRLMRRLSFCVLSISLKWANLLTSVPSGSHLQKIWHTWLPSFLCVQYRKEFGRQYVGKWSILILKFCRKQWPFLIIFVNHFFWYMFKLSVIIILLWYKLWPTRQKWSVCQIYR